jgi:ELP3 family radical SAM enzyme/protein acetyltransferase
MSDCIDIEDVAGKAGRLHFGSLKSPGVSWDTILQNEHEYKTAIKELVEWTEDHEDDPLIRKSFSTFYNSLSRTLNKKKVFLKKSVLTHYYRDMVSNGEIKEYPLVQTLLQKRPSRNASGVTVITVLTSPYPDGQSFSCKHNCYYCPNEPDMPRSYLKEEPAVARGFRNKWSAKEQMLDRMRVLQGNGHEIDKLEIIIEGGTYTEYPATYLEKFHEELIYTANTFYDTPDPLTGEIRPSLGIDEEVRLNANSRCRIIGICIETRPDSLKTRPFKDRDDTWLRCFRKWGVTRIQLGLQHTNNAILKKINRGHTREKAEFAIKYLKDNGFKVDIHLMPDLPGSSPEEDTAMFEYVYTSPKIQPDQIKIYPCEVVPWTRIQEWHKEGKYKPYAQTNERALLDVVKSAIRDCPPWVRLPRVIRDIPLTYIEGGNMYPNLRQMLEAELTKEGVQIQEIRARECTRHPEYRFDDVVYRVRKYEASDGKEVFISCESEDAVAIFGFLRLRFPSSSSSREFACLTDRTALVRELHVYGNVLPVGTRTKTRHHDQHRGIGKRLLQMAESIALWEGYSKIAVISGIGVVEYYKKRGYHSEDYYMVKSLSLANLYGLLGILIGIFMMTIMVYLIF